MNKILALLLVLLITLSSVIGAGNLSVINLINPSAGNPGTSVSGSFNVKNDGVDVLNGITFVKSDLTNVADPSAKILSTAVTFNPASIGSLSGGQTSSVIVPSVGIPSLTKSGTYNGNVEVRDSTGTNTTIFVLTIVVNNFPKLSIDGFSDTNPLEVTEEQGNKATGTFLLKNDGNTALSNLDISNNIVLRDNDNDTISLTFTGLPASLNSGSSATITVNADIGDDVDFGTYSGIVTIKDLVQIVQTSFKLNIKVEPRVCEDGIRSNGNPGGDNLRVDIKEPKTSKRFAPGEEINLKINVKNNGNRDNDVIVNAFLFDLDDNEIVVEEETESITVQDGKSEDFEFSIKIPVDVDVNNKFALFVKAFEEDDEDRNCGQERQDTEIRRERDSVTIEKFVLSPISLACGENFDAAIDLQNIGTNKQDDVSVRLFDDELKVDLVSNSLELDKFDNSNDHATVRFRDIKVPLNIAEKQYQLESLLSYKNGDNTESKFSTLTVSKCEKLQPTTPGESRKVSLQVLVSSFNVKSGESLSVPVTVTNSDTVQTQYVVEIQNIQDFAEQVLPKTLILNAGQSETVYFNLNTKDNLGSGKYTGTLVVKSGNVVLDTKAITINAEKSGLFTGLTSTEFNGTKIFWVIADIILVIIAVFFIKLIFGRRKKIKGE